ncbi:hypothetical protein PTSG_01591 [Salpingoeca rosetta]|uniref:BBSome complex member BBS5 n=1 Tax=Salpingoeca rosetta (strain ATCC 50818 / BSB-021) TaxID=946362 RepID=F2TYE0_SALR5|nr:uncharacterized protein PTSG_01591 [Salpingoeca rosetta]EGD78614.1 hypothetical protein PTSG_01591 [Salpingoeca rosetta]|eukprot:XP_004997572.1 hypothetical protein PTSG_01591 [Salpingoeca rosetta]
MTTKSDKSPAKPAAPEPWRDHEVRFDSIATHMQPGPGEVIIDSLSNVEDTQGNNGVRGKLVVTNLRIMWHAIKKPSVNLSIGLFCISQISVKMVESKLKGGRTQALTLVCKFKKMRFSFVFTYLVPSSPRLFTIIQAVHRAYDSTRLYREVVVRSSTLVSDDRVAVLPDEEIFDTLDGVWNLSGDKGELGTMVVSNIRCIWYSDLDPRFNVTIPYCMMSRIAIRNSKFGKALVVKTAKAARSLTIGFRIDPADRLQRVAQKMERLHRVYHASPIYGVHVDVETAEGEGEGAGEMETEDDDIEIIQRDDFDVLAAYANGRLGQEASEDNKMPVYSEELGLAIEPLLPGFTLDALANIAC